MPVDLRATDRFLRLSTDAVEARRSTERAYGRVVETMAVDQASIGEQKFFDRVQPFLAVLDDEPDLHASAVARANAILATVAAGVPVIVKDRRALESLLPGGLLDQLVEPHPADVTNTHDRERIAARQRRAAWALLAPRHRGDTESFGHRRRSVSVTIVSNRPDKAAHWASLIAQQDHPNFEVVAVTHGDGFTERDRAIVREQLGDRLTLLSASKDQNLGDALNMAAEAASGELIIKWDDDDYYSSKHLRDLAGAYEVSGAHIVGKGAEFAYLAAIDVTIRRGSLSREAFSPSLTGATLTIGREDLFEVGGWPSLPRRVDTQLIARVTEAGGSTFRTSGFGFLMMRDADLTQHTWDADVGYFLDRATEQRRGLDLDFADVDLDV